jgi:hypothetical protein
MLIAVAVDETASTQVANPSSTPPVTPLPSPRAAAYSFSPNIAHILEEQHATNQFRPSEVVGAELCAELRAEETTQATVAATAAKDFFEAFSARITDAGNLSSGERDRILSKAYQDCCPTTDHWAYNIMIIRHILRLEWDPKTILEQYAAASFAVPPIHSSEALDLLACLDKLSSQASHCAPEVHKLYVKLAEKASSAAPSSPYQDTRVLMLVRQLWKSAHSQGVGLDDSVLALLSSVAKKIRSKLCRTTLRAILGNSTRMEHRVMNLVAQVAEEPGLLEASVRILSCVPQERLHEWIPRITLVYARGASHKAGVEKAKSVGRMHVWMQLLHHLDAESAVSKSALMDTAMTPLAEFTFAHRNSLQARIPALLNALVVKAFQSDTFQDVPMSSISNLLRAFSTAVGQSSSIPVDVSLGILFSELRAKTIPHEALAGTIIDIFIRHGALEEIRTILQVLDRRSLTLADAEQVYEMVARRVAPIQSHGISKTESARQHHAYHLRICQDIMEVVSRISASPKGLQLDLKPLQAQRQFEHILVRAQADHALPLAYRNVSARIPIQDRVALIHQLAHQYTTDGTRSLRETYRATYYLYRYLQEHSLPIGPLFSKAVVRISIIRPLSENRFVSARRLIWVCRLVTSVEGEEVAKQIEAAFWQWRGDLIQHAKSVYVGVGGDRQSKAHIGTMKKLGLI